jgi:hypothetical protein
MLLVFTTALFFSCSVPKDPTPNAHPNAKVFTSVINTSNAGNSGTANVIDSVSVNDEVAKLELQVTGTSTAKYIYIVKSSDNGAFIPLSFPTITNSYGIFTGGTTNTYSLMVPNLSIFTLDIFVVVRNTTVATNDVYKIWITDSLTSFTMPADHRILGMATINLLYKSSALPNTYTSGVVSMGSQSSKDYGSFLVTTGIMNALDSTNYNRSPESVDIRLVTLTGGKKDNNSSELWLYSPADILTANPAVSGQDDFVLPVHGSSNTTYFDTYSGAIIFDSIKTVAPLLTLPAPTSKSVNVVVNGVYIFQTQEGKRGLIKITSANATTNVRGTGSTTAQDIGVAVKVLD